MTYSGGIIDLRKIGRVTRICVVNGDRSMNVRNAGQ